MIEKYNVEIGKLMLSFDIFFVYMQTVFYVIKNHFFSLFFYFKVKLVKNYTKYTKQVTLYLFPDLKKNVISLQRFWTFNCFILLSYWLYPKSGKQIFLEHHV